MAANILPNPSVTNAQSKWWWGGGCFFEGFECLKQGLTP